MLSRALSFATVMLLIGGLAAAPARAQNLEAGKSPSQIFSGTCTACHKGARGLLKTVAPGSLPGFLRQHYTTSSEMAGVLASYLISNGATDTRYQGGEPRAAKDARQEPSGQPTQLDRSGRPIRRAPAQEASRPDADGRVPARASEGQPAAGAEERGPDGRRLSTKQRLSKRGRGEELPKTEAAKPAAPMGEAAKGDASKEENSSISKEEVAKPEIKPEEQQSDSAKLDAPKGETPASDVPLRADPVPAVTAAPKSSEGEGTPAESPPAPESSPGGSPASTSASNAAAEPQASPPAAPVAAVPPPPPPAPAGPPAPPISQ
ncbi:MAG: hypothetical protein QOH32_4444 [Bradyrhizobium sp.]|jgi:hypothetical protein|nr:hypothetical protein [Bradyrhizobium sp.]